MLSAAMRDRNILCINHTGMLTPVIAGQGAQSAYTGGNSGPDNDRVSRPGEFHPEALAEPDVTLSRHPAPIKEPLRKTTQCANSSGLRRETAATHRRARRM
jgi:hypothetical protein